MHKDNCGLILALDVLTLEDARSFLKKLKTATPPDFREKP